MEEWILKKYVLEDRHRECLKMYQKKCGMSDADISKKLGYSPAWFNQIRKGRISSLKAEDLVALLALFYDIDTKDAIKSDVVDKFYNYMLEEQKIGDKESIKNYAKFNCNKWLQTLDAIADEDPKKAYDLLDKINDLIYTINSSRNKGTK